MYQISPLPIFWACPSHDAKSEWARGIGVISLDKECDCERLK